jgi:hypothetical protein
VRGVTSIPSSTHYADADLRGAGVNFLLVISVPRVFLLPALITLLFACDRAGPPGPPSGGAPPQLSEGEDAPVRALYLCANRFILVNAHPFPVRVTWRVQGTADPAGVSKVSFIAIGSTTHAFDMNQRFMWLAFTRTSGAISVTPPSSGSVAPPGYYMLFLLNAKGVPSKARIIRLR